MVRRFKYTGKRKNPALSYLIYVDSDRFIYDPNRVLIIIWVAPGIAKNFIYSLDFSEGL